MNGHNYGLCRKCNKIHIHPKGSAGFIPWNKGLTKDNPRVKEYVDKGVKTRVSNGTYVANSGTFKKGQTRAHFPKGRKNPKLSTIKKSMYDKNEIKRLFGKDNPSWKGGIYKLSRQIRFSRKYTEWRNLILNRDKSICQICYKYGINVHHKIEFINIIKEFNIKSYEDSLKCVELWDLNNGITLCKDCHDGIHGLKKA